MARRNPFTALRQRLERVDMSAATRRAAEAAEDDLADLNREQLLSGSGADSKRLRPIYSSDYYARKKHALNPLAGYAIPDLKLTGAFHKSIRAAAGGAGITFVASDEKAEHLLPKYAPVLGLTYASIAKAREIIKPELRREFRRQIRP